MSNNPTVYVDPNGEDKVKAVAIVTGISQASQVIVDYDSKTGVGSIKAVIGLGENKSFVTGEFNTNKGTLNVRNFNSNGEGGEYSVDNFKDFGSLNLHDLLPKTVEGLSFGEEAFNQEIAEMSEQDAVNFGTIAGSMLMKDKKVHRNFINLFEYKGTEFGPLKKGRSTFDTVVETISNNREGETIRIQLENVNQNDFNIFKLMNRVLNSSPEFNMDVVINNTLENDK